VGELTSEAVPPIGDDDHVVGEGPETIAYLDLACPHCAAAWTRLRAEPIRLCFRHFPIASKRPRSPALHAAAEAAAAQAEDAFWRLVASATRMTRICGTAPRSSGWTSPASRPTAAPTLWWRGYDATSRAGSGPASPVHRPTSETAARTQPANIARVREREF
jgi:hypothetical protein